VHTCDVVVVGAGIAGSTLARSLAEDGLDVVLLERVRRYLDRVRGEALLPWGVKEARELGAEQVLLDAGAHTATDWIQYGPWHAPGEAGAGAIAIGQLVPGIAGSLNVRHPDACAALAGAASATGARVIAGVRELRLSPGEPPRVQYSHLGGDDELRPRLVVGADGRHSVVRRQSGIALQHQPELHMVAGLLLETDGIPTSADFTAAAADLFMVGFQQRGGRLRVYLCPGLTGRQRFAGRAGITEFLRSLDFDCLPFGSVLAQAQPAGPVATYPADDSWTDRPFADGVVLVGDAAGWNNPIIGQGLSLAMCDVRIVRDMVRAGDLTAGAFAGYGSERDDRMRRVRTASTFLAVAMAEDADDRRARQIRWAEMVTDDPVAMTLMLSVLTGPHFCPDEALDGHLLHAVRGTQLQAHRTLRR
jgi:2-polyprenyl-6-methoxyphenol hydroxylase-like FAD-dependent oxidoreductase